MSHVSVKPASGARQPSFDELLTSFSKLLAASIDSTRVLLQQAAAVLPRAPGLPMPGTRDMCAIPETECPPRCVCEVTWRAAPGETPGLAIRVRNASKAARTFALSATPFTGAGGSPGKIALAPTSLSLPPGESGLVDATLTVPNVAPGDYEAEIVVRGAYEQCVRVTLEVRGEKACGDERCLCEVVQGEPPVRIRAHHWYDHFQCTERCVEPRRSPDRDDHHGPG
jgi:hypothetical protein